MPGEAHLWVCLRLALKGLTEGEDLLLGGGPRPHKKGKRREPTGQLHSCLSVGKAN